MLGIKIQDTFLSLFPGTKLSFEMAHPIGIIVDGADQISGGFSLPVEIPLDDVNVSIIGHANRLDVDSILMRDEYCEVWSEGLPIYIGLATVKKSSRERASIFMVFNEVKSLESVMLAAVDLGGDREIGEDTATRLAHAKDTATNPLDYDYIFCPVLNPVFPVDPSGINTSILGSHLQNDWNTSTDEFTEFVTGFAMPFIRLDYLLERIALHIGYTLDNQWQTTDELKQIIIYNNRSIYADQDTWDTIINLSNHVPSRSCIELIKAIVGTFALDLTFDPIDKTMTLIPFRDLIEAPEEADWTAKAAHDYGIDTDHSFIAIFRYDIDPDDLLSVQYGGSQFNQSLIGGEGLTARILSSGSPPIGVRYSISDNIIYFIGGTDDADYIYQQFTDVTKTGSTKEYISPLIPMWSSWDLALTGYIENDMDFQAWLVPHIRYYGYSLHYPWQRQPLNSIRLMMYRGFQPYDEGISGTYPMAGCTAYNIRGNKVGDYALTWDRDEGIFEQWWKLPYQMLSNKKEVVRTLRLSIADLLSFRFSHKIRIENQHYFITRLRFTLSDQGVSPTEATMITIG